MANLSFQETILLVRSIYVDYDKIKSSHHPSCVPPLSEDDIKSSFDNWDKIRVLRKLLEELEKFEPIPF